MANPTIRTPAVVAAIAEELPKASFPGAWRRPVRVENLIGNATIAYLDGLTPATGDAYCVTTAGTPAAGASDALAVGDLAEFDGTQWKLVVGQIGGFPPAGARALLSTAAALVAPYVDGTDDGKLVQFDGASLTALDSADAVAGAAVIALASPAKADSKFLRFDGVVPAGLWKQISGGGGGSALPWSAVALKTNANNGQDLELGKLNVLATVLSGADVDLNLPDAVVDALPVGTPVYVAVEGGNFGVLRRGIVRTQGADVMGGSGVPSGTTRLTWQVGMYVFTYAGTGLGPSTWLVQLMSGERSEQQVVIATHATDVLAAFTASGSGVDQILTANANGVFTLPDGSQPGAFAGGYQSILYRNREPSQSAYNGLWVLLAAGVDDVEEGDGAPWVLRRHPLYSRIAQSLSGKLIVVDAGAGQDSDEAGSAFVSAVGSTDPTASAPLVRLAGQPIRRRINTFGATPTTIATVRAVDNKLLLIHARITAFNPVTRDHARWVMDAVLDYVDPVITQKSKTFLNGPVKDAALATTDVTLFNDAPDLRIRVTGVAATQLRWFVEFFEARYG